MKHSWNVLCIPSESPLNFQLKSCLNLPLPRSFCFWKRNLKGSSKWCRVGLRKSFLTWKNDFERFQNDLDDVLKETERCWKKGIKDFEMRELDKFLHDFSSSENNFLSVQNEFGECWKGIWRQFEHKGFLWFWKPRIQEYDTCFSWF